MPKPPRTSRAPCREKAVLRGPRSRASEKRDGPNAIPSTAPFPFLPLRSLLLPVAKSSNAIVILDGTSVLSLNNHANER
jgi:hypothetical protein